KEAARRTRLHGLTARPARFLRSRPARRCWPQITREEQVMKKEPEELQQVSKFGEDLTAGEALEKMRSEGVTIGLVVDRVRSLPKALLSERELERADPKTKLEKLVMHAPELVSVKAPYKLSDVVQRHAKYVELRPNLPGVLVDVGE